jgi:hypothetical protein
MDDEKLEAWLHQQKKDLEELGKSTIMASLVSGAFLKDPRCMLQLGAALMMGKPIVLIVLDDTPLPAKLRGVADRIIRVKRDDMGRASEELAEFVKALP